MLDTRSHMQATQNSAKPIAKALPPCSSLELESFSRTHLDSRPTVLHSTPQAGEQPRGQEQDTASGTNHSPGNPIDGEIRLEQRIMKVGMGLLAANYARGILIWSFAEPSLHSHALWSFLYCAATYFALRLGEGRLKTLHRRAAGQTRNGDAGTQPRRKANSRLLSNLWLVLAALDVPALCTAISASQWSQSASLGIGIATKLFLCYQERRNGKILS